MGHLYYHILSLETSEKSEKYKSYFEFSFNKEEKESDIGKVTFSFVRRDYSVSENIETDNRFINEVFLNRKNIDDVPSLRITNTESRVRTYLKDLSVKERTAFDREYQVFRDKNKEIKAPLLQFINSDSKAALALRQILIEKVVKRSDYTRIPKEYLGTLGYSLDMSQIDSLCRNQYKECFKDGDLALKTLRASEAKENCLGFTPAVISLTISKKYRLSLYEQGFDLCYDDHIYHYVRYKRSASNARNRQCIFIVDSIDGKRVVNAKGKSLKDTMYEWSNCGLTNPYTDPASWEAYSALTLSGIEKDLVTLDRKSILLIKDRESIFYDKKGCSPVYQNTEEAQDNSLKAANPSKISENGKSYEELFLIKNTIWDGQALIDESVFEDESNSCYKDAHFMLLRSRFFKSCAFKTKLQKWFSDNGINDVSQLKGYTLAEDISDIKLVITESSLKYLKFYKVINKNKTKDELLEKGFETWLKENSCKRKDKEKNTMYAIDFGVVKTDHPSSGRIRTSYQYLNSIGITEKQARAFTENEIDTIERFLESPTEFGEYLKRILRRMSSDTSKTDVDDEDIETIVDNVSSRYLDYQYQIASISRLIDISDDCAHLQVYKDFLTDQVEKMVEHLRKGRILIDGLYATLFGNPAEYLYATIYDYNPNEKNTTYYYKVNGEEKKLVTLKNNHVYCKNRVFKDRDKLVGARYPHVTMGNLFVTRNERDRNSFYEQYFDFGEEVVCINSVNSNILHQLNGADFDSDTMMLTNNPTIYIAAKRQKDYFRIPVSQIRENAIESNVDVSEADYIKWLTVVDGKLNGSSLGEIINLASYLNGEFWAKYPIESWKENKNKDMVPNINDEAASKLYDAICCLAILSGAVIDNAKRSTSCDIYKEINIARRLKMQSRIVIDNGHPKLKEIPEYYRKSILKSENQRYNYDEKPKGYKYSYNYLMSLLSDECIKYKVFDSISRACELDKEKRIQLFNKYIGDNQISIEEYDKQSRKYERELNDSNKYSEKLRLVMDMTEDEYEEFLDEAAVKIENVITEVSKVLGLPESVVTSPHIFDSTAYVDGIKTTLKPTYESEQHCFMGYINRFINEESNKKGSENRLRKKNSATWKFKELFIDNPPEEELTETEKEKMRHILNLIEEAQMYIYERQYDIRMGFDTQYEMVRNKVSNLRSTIREYLGDDSANEKIVNRTRMVYELINKVDDEEYKKCRRLLVAMILDEKVMTDDMIKRLRKRG